MSYIVPEKMPMRCFECKEISSSTIDGYSCSIAHKSLASEHGINVRRPDWCPLIEIPTPHGRLIDKDKLRHDLFVNFNGERIPFYDCDNFPTKISYRDLHSILAEQKTVIEAEGEKDGR